MNQKITREVIKIMRLITSVFMLFYPLRTGIYKLTLSDNKLGMTKEIIATKVLPFLFPLSIENGLTVMQYNAVMGLIKVRKSKFDSEFKIKNTLREKGFVGRIFNTRQIIIKHTSIGFDKPC